MITTNITLKASVCLFVLSVTAAAQYYGDQPDNSRLRTISTAGAAEVRVVPSRVVITFGVETTNPGLAAAKQENDTKSAAIISMAKASGVQPKDVQTDYVFVEPCITVTRMTGEENSCITSSEKRWWCFCGTFPSLSKC
jgi:uncharacterized protein YggE